MSKHLLLLALSGPLLCCGKRGDPRPPLPRTPQAVGEFKVAQRGDRIELGLVAPRTTTGGERLPVLEIEFLYAPTGGDFLKAAERVVKKAAPGERLAETLPLPTLGTAMRFSARAKVGGETSALAPVITFAVDNPPPAPSGLTARPQASGIALSFVPAPLPSPSPTPSAPPSAAPPGPSPAARPSPTPPPRLSGTFVYRRGPGGVYARPLTAVPLATGVTSLDDESAGFGESWCYVARTVLSAEPLIESRDSEEVCLDFKDLFPPAAPTGVTVLPRPEGLEVSWSPSPETDLAAYRVYRRIKGGAPEAVGELAGTETGLLDRVAPRATPLLYTVTALDKAGNESAHSKAMEARRP
ncbi:MAG TPA: hypothetical protein VJU18_07170 [Vicinamibacteria bacterium]|nr:hypothetical protein [Vicinamibacteria bacterium]